MGLNKKIMKKIISYLPVIRGNEHTIICWYVVSEYNSWI
jgi:hypothetical protein